VLFFPVVSRCVPSPPSFLAEVMGRSEIQRLVLFGAFAKNNNIPLVRFFVISDLSRKSELAFFVPDIRAVTYNGGCGRG
jgi:hypothetical protein